MLHHVGAMELRAVSEPRLPLGCAWAIVIAFGAWLAWTKLAWDSYNEPQRVVAPR